MKQPISTRIEQMDLGYIGPASLILSSLFGSILFLENVIKIFHVILFFFKTKNGTDSVN